MMDDNCIFCKLANGVFPTNKIYEDDEFTVILDINPANLGHALILPKQHYANLFEIDEEVAGRAMKLAKKVATIIKEELGCDGINVVQNNGIAAGQTVFHFHVHIIPRYDDDGCKIGWPQREVDEASLAEMTKRLAEKF